jgi:hypothetical protein
MKAVFKIKSRMARNVNTDSRDVILVKETLSNLGHYNIPNYGLTPFPDRNLFKGIGNFQKETGLPVTESIDPGDDTETEIGGRSTILRCVNCGAPHGGTYGDLCYFCFIKTKSNESDEDESMPT